MRRALLLLYAFFGGCRSAPPAQAADEQQVAPAQHSDSMAGMEAEHAMAGMMSNEDLHLRLTPRRAATTADSARAAEVLATMRRELVKYADVSVAEADGYRQFLPGVSAPLAPLPNFSWALASRRALDPARPTSLLYQRDSTGRFTLVGAMFTAPPSTGDDELDRRLPLSIARWHEHVNWCLPPAGARVRSRARGRDVRGPPAARRRRARPPPAAVHCALARACELVPAAGRRARALARDEGRAAGLRPEVADRDARGVCRRRRPLCAATVRLDGARDGVCER